MWIVAWGLIFLHFFVRIFESSGGRLGSLAYAVDLGGLQVAGIVFTVSLTVMGDIPRRRWLLFSLLVPPVLLYTAALSFQLDFRWLYVSCLAVLFFGSSLFIFAQRPR